MLNVEEKSGSKEEVTYKPSNNEKQDFFVLETETKKRIPVFLYFCVLTADILTYIAGIGCIWSSPVIPKLKSTDPSINPLGAPITDLQESWIASLPPLGATIGPLLIGKFADTYGRKKALISVTTLLLVAFVSLAFATNIYVYYFARVLSGVGGGMAYSVLPSYIAETCDDRNRGMFGCIMGVFFAIGALYVIVVGPHLSIKLFTLSCAAPLVFLFASLVLVIPESPVFLVLVGREEEARIVLTKLKNKDRRGVEKDLLEIQQIIEETSKTSKGNCLELFKTPVLLKALVVSMGLGALQQFSGISAILAFIQPVFEMTGSEISPDTSAIVVALVQVVGVVVASSMVEKLGRKFLLLSSSVSCAISLTTLGIYFHLKHSQVSYLGSIFWLPIASLVVFIFFYNIGLGSVVWAVVGEVFPSNLKATAGSLTITFCALTAFLVTFLFPIFIEQLGPANSFCTLGIFCVLGTVFIYFVVPETKGKNIVEIQRELAGEKK